MTGAKEPTDVELLAAAAAIARTGRKVIEATDRTSSKDVGETLDALHEHLAVAGGSLLILAERLGLGGGGEAPPRRGTSAHRRIPRMRQHGGKSMSSVRLIDGQVLHLPGMPFLTDSHSVILAPAEDDLAALVPLIPVAELLLFTGRLVTGARKRRRQARYAEVNVARLKLARLCIDQALADWQAVQELPDA